ncbi:MAG: hypothetical protein GEU99_16050 [Luteitalea sp.]|nr:hypothetical protein [Luteitalea sp.]
MSARQRFVTTLFSLFLTGMIGTVYAQDFPSSTSAETTKIVFHNAADLPSVLEHVGSARIVKLRAFVTDEGQVDTVRQAVADAFRARQSLPAMTVVRVGRLPGGVPVSWESIAESSQTANAQGLAFISGQAASAPDPETPLASMAEKSRAALRSCLRASDARSEDVVRVTCLMSSLADLDAVKRVMEAEFTQAAFGYIQLEKTPSRAVIECEAVARLRSAPSQPLLMVHPSDLEQSPNYSHVALVGSPNVAFTSAHLAKGEDAASARAAFEELRDSLQEAGASIGRVAMSSLYPTSPKASKLISDTRFDFYDRANPPASTLMNFEGLPGGSVFAVDVVAPIE